MGNFDVNLSEKDEAQLKTLAKDTAYSRLAGSFQQYAAGEMALGAGEGMAQGGGALSGAFLGAGIRRRGSGLRRSGRRAGDGEVPELPGRQPERGQVLLFLRHFAGPGHGQ